MYYLKATKDVELISKNNRKLTTIIEGELLTVTEFTKLEKQSTVKSFFELQSNTINYVLPKSQVYFSFGVRFEKKANN